MAKANAVRGEIALTLAGKDYVMRPTWEAIIAFEETTGKSLVTLARLSTSGDLTLRQMAAIAGECTRAYGRESGTVAAAFSDDRLAELIAAEGALHVLKPVQKVLLAAATGGVTATGELKPVATKAGAATGE